MKIIDERKNDNYLLFYELPIGEFFHERSDDGEDGVVYVKVSNVILEAQCGKKLFNAWSVNDNRFCSFDDCEQVIKLNVEITLKN